MDFELDSENIENKVAMVLQNVFDKEPTYSKYNTTANSQNNEDEESSTFVSLSETGNEAKLVRAQKEAITFSDEIDKNKKESDEINFKNSRVETERNGKDFLEPKKELNQKGPDNKNEEETPKDYDDKFILIPLSTISTENLIYYIKSNKKILQLLTSKIGSEYMQYLIPYFTEEVTDLLLNKICAYLPKLMVDNYGNYFCQKFFVILNKAQRIKFINEISSSLIEISNNNVGTYPCQFLVKNLGSIEEKNIFKNAILQKINELLINQNGVHVIEKMVSVYNDNEISEIYDIIINNFLYLSMNGNGLFICKKMISKCQTMKYKSKIKFILLSAFIFILHNQYSNFTLQVAIESWDIQFLSEIFVILEKNFIELSCEKYSSNIIEKFLEKIAVKMPETLVRIVNNIVSNSNILSFIKNLFGNFVLLKVIKLSSQNEKYKIALSLKANLPKINNPKFFIKWNFILKILIRAIKSENSEEINKLFDNSFIMKKIKNNTEVQEFCSKKNADMQLNNNGLINNNINLNNEDIICNNEFNFNIKKEFNNNNLECNYSPYKNSYKVNEFNGLGGGAYDNLRQNVIYNLNQQNLINNNINVGNYFYLNNSINNNYNNNYNDKLNDKINNNTNILINNDKVVNNNNNNNINQNNNYNNTCRRLSDDISNNDENNINFCKNIDFFNHN